MDENLREDLTALLDRIAKEVYASDDRYRVTILGRSERVDAIQSLLRWEDGRVREVKKTRVAFRKGQVAAGRAWESPGDLFVLELPQFNDRADLQRYYVEQLGFPAEFPRHLSLRMVKTREILCVGLHLNADDAPIVLSVDTFAVPGVVRKRKGSWVLRREIRLLSILQDFRDALFVRSLCGVSP